MGSGIINSFLGIPSGTPTTVIIVESHLPILLHLPIISPSNIDTLKSNGFLKLHPRPQLTVYIADSLRRAAQEVPPEGAPEAIIEVLPEKFDVKVALYKEIESLYPSHVIIGSNTSSLPLQKMADTLKHPERFVGVHYNHPAHIVPIVEVTKLKDTTDKVVHRINYLLKLSNKVPILLRKPIDGFITNRLQHALYREIYSLMEDGSVDAKDIDDVAKYMFGPRMCVTGLLLQKDCSGLDTHARTQSQMVQALSNNTTLGKVLKDKYDAGHYGLKSGQGFYNWTNADPKLVQEDINTRLSTLYQYLNNNQVPYIPQAHL